MKISIVPIVEVSELSNGLFGMVHSALLRADVHDPEGLELRTDVNVLQELIEHGFREEIMTVLEAAVKECLHYDVEEVVFYHPDNQKENKE